MPNVKDFTTCKDQCLGLLPDFSSDGLCSELSMKILNCMLFSLQILLCNVRLVLTIKAIMVDVSQRGYSTAKTPISMYPCQDLVGSGGEGEALSLQVNIDLPHFSKFLSG